MIPLSTESTVFVVDSDPGTRDSVVSMVRTMGLKSVVFETGEEFLSEDHHLEPGCVVADLRMRGMNGIAMLKSMRQDGSRMPLLLVTAYASVPLVVEAIERGAMTILEKPYQSQTLWDQIVRALQFDQEQRSNAALRTNLLDRIGWPSVSNATGETSL